MEQKIWNQDVYTETLRCAAEAHIGQTVSGSEISYLLHLSIVCMEAIAALRHEPGHSEDLVVQLALLHDTIEDTHVTYEQLRERFGAQVADGVLALTKDETLPKAEQMADSLRRIREQPVEVWMVKLSDRICNLQPAPAHWTSEKKAGYREEAQQILTALEAASPYLAARLQAKIASYAID